MTLLTGSNIAVHKKTPGQAGRFGNPIQSDFSTICGSSFSLTWHSFHFPWRPTATPM
jgi:hypothetical protein